MVALSSYQYVYRRNNINNAYDRLYQKSYTSLNSSKVSSQIQCDGLSVFITCFFAFSSIFFCSSLAFLRASFSLSDSDGGRDMFDMIEPSRSILGDDFNYGDNNNKVSSFEIERVIIE